MTEIPGGAKVLIWIVAAALLHDLVALPALQRAAAQSPTGAADARDRATRRGDAAGPQRTSASRPGCRCCCSRLLPADPAGRPGGATVGTPGSAVDPYLGRWLLISAALFLISGIVYAIRLRRGRSPSPQPPPRPAETKARRRPSRLLADRRRGGAWRAAPLAVCWVVAALVVGLLTTGLGVWVRPAPVAPKSHVRRATRDAPRPTFGPMGRTRRSRANGASPSVEHAALVLLVALVACAVVALVRDRASGEDALARLGDRVQAALRGPLPRPVLAGPADRGVRARARRGGPGARPGAGAGPARRTGLVGVDYRRCRQVSCADVGGTAPDRVEPADDGLHLGARSCRRRPRRSTTGSTGRRSAGS